MGKLKKLGFSLLSVILILATITMGICFGWSNAPNFVSHFLLDWDPEIPDPEAVTYYSSRFANMEEAAAYSKEIAIQTQAAGTVLLENNGTLPLDPSERRISVFGTASVNPVYGGTGSGEGNREKITDLYTALEEEGFVVNPALRDFYEKMAKQGYRRGKGTDMNGRHYGLKGSRSYGYSINEIEIERYSDELKASFRDYADAAIVVLARSGGEGQDLPTSMLDFHEGDDRHYLEPTEEELALLQEVLDASFQKVIVVLNTLNAFECGFLEEAGIDAALWIGGTGQHGMTAVAKMLTGELCPEGRLPDTWARDLLSAPAMQNYGDNRYVDEGKITTAAYVAYAEGIYVGYRYYETRALDEGEQWYRENVVYPFGYGLSYTSFQWSDLKLAASENGFNISVTVTNTGSMAGRDVVELYLRKPYTDYDRKTGVEKSAADLVGFAKTRVLEPGMSESLTIDVERRLLASYDAYGAQTYLAEAGEYLFMASRDAHTPVLEATVILPLDEKFDRSETGAVISNRFETAEYSSRPEDLSLLSRADWEGTWPSVYGDGGTAGDASMTLTPERKTAILSTDCPGASGLSGVPVTASGAGHTFSELFDQNGKPLDYDDPLWMETVQCMTREELYYLVSAGSGRSPAIESIQKQQSNTSDSPMGFRVGTLFPCYPIQAATWSTEIASEIGNCIAEEALLNNIHGWYAPAMDTHRTPFGGRNYEYYSEDGILAGNYAVSVCAAAREKGLSHRIKHFALNDQDTNRGDRGNFRNNDPYNGLCTYAGEQAIWELYLKPFELAITKGGADGVMTSYNRIGDIWAGGHYGLMTEVLRNEWGLHGNALTDYAGTFGYRYMNMKQGLLAGNSQWLYVGNAFPTADRESDEMVLLMQRAAKEILYSEASSSRVNNQRHADGSSVEVQIRWQRWQYIAVTAYLALLALWLYTRKKAR
ncbi:MAG: glycoside hydrolase family 3 protein [Oscillospiraceae bacterium]|nr:glycoside hydrolase family 3 protein [Oscillospiraceae bacterium]